METNKSIYLLEGRLCVQSPRGYWFTSGGDKGSFGFYPHLKQEGYPVYPDTQIHGNMKMAARWLCRIDSKTYHADLIPEIFGFADNAQSSRFKVADLELAAKDQWKKEHFDVKTRTEIDDTTRTNKRHMLVDLEWAYLDNQILEAKVYLGYFDDKERLEQARTLIDDCLDLLSGFGASRSRGAGRGKVKIKWNDAPGEITYQRKTAEKNDKSFCWVLEPLVNFRNKQINPGASQLICSETKISSQQLRAWFSRTYYRLFSEWPSPDQMERIDFLTAYPALKKDDLVIPAYPPPNTTLVFEDNHMEDMYGQQDNKEKETEQENFVRSKAKPLPASTFLTNTEIPEKVALKIFRRIRNATVNEGNFKNGIGSMLTDMDENFTTIESGLFVQELILKKQPFASTIHINDTEETSDFCDKARFIFSNVYPDIGGAFFRPEIRAEKSENSGEDKGKPNHYLVCETIPFLPDRMRSPGSQVAIGVDRSYATVHKRPRRNRIVFLSGSLIDSPVENKTLAWKGLGQKNITDMSQKSELSKPDDSHRDGENEFNPGKMSLSQAGNLREMLLMRPEAAKIRIEEILEKYRKWEKSAIEEHLIPENILKALLDYLNNGDSAEFKRTVQSVCSAVSLKKWKQEKKRIISELKEAKSEYLKTKSSGGKGGRI